MLYCGLTSTGPYSPQQERLRPSLVACGTAHGRDSLHRSCIQHPAGKEVTARRGPHACSPCWGLLCNTDTTLVCLAFN